MTESKWYSSIVWFARRLYWTVDDWLRLTLVGRCEEHRTPLHWDGKCAGCEYWKRARRYDE